jgi:hypothetical protein
LTDALVQSTLAILEEAYKLDIPMLWIQPGAQDEAVINFIVSSGMEDRCIYPKPHSHPLSLLDADLDEPATNTTPGGCFGQPSVIEAIENKAQEVAADTANVLRSKVDSVASAGVARIDSIAPCLFARLSS